MFQFAIFYLAIPTACAFAFHRLGGEYQRIFDNVPSSYLTINFEKLSLWMFLSIIFDRLLPHSEPAFIQRFLMVQNRKQVYHSLIIISLLSLPLIVIISTIGILARALEINIDPNTVFFHIISYYLPQGIIGLLVIGMLAVIMSTADSWLNTTAILCAHDAAKKLFPNLSEQQELLIARVSTIIIAILSACLVLQGTGFLEFIWLADNFWQPIILIPLSAGFLKFQANTKSFLVSVIAAIFFVILGRYIDGKLATISLFFGVMGSTAGFFGMHYWQIMCRKKAFNGTFKIKNISTYLRKSINAIIRLAINSCLIILRRAFFDSAQIIKEGTIFYVFCLFIILNFIIFLFIGLTANHILYLRIIAAILCLLVCFKDYWPQRLKEKMLYYIWYILILFCLPFTASYTIFTGNNEKLLLINSISLILFLYLLVSWLNFIILLSLGSLLGYCYSYIFPIEITTSSISPYVHAFAYFYCFLTILTVLIFSRIKEARLNMKLKIARLLSGSIAHELRAPLSVIKMQIENLDSKDLSEQHNKNTRDIIVTAVQRSQAFINTTLLNLKDTIPQNEEETLSMLTCTKLALSTYPFEGNQISQITVDTKQDFTFRGNKTFVIHVIINLLNNAIYYTRQIPNALIKITVDGRNGKKLLTIYDNGPGIDKETMCNIFQPFFSKKKSGIGIGLAFCKMVMENLGGNIECYSEEGKFTEFKLTFL